MKKIILLLLVVLIAQNQTVFAKAKSKAANNACKPTYTFEQGEYKGYQIMKCGKVYGIRTSFSKVAVPPKYSKLEVVNDEFLKVQFNKKYGIIGFNNRMYVAPNFEDVQIAEIKLKQDKPMYVFLAKTSGNWYIMNDARAEAKLIKDFEVKNKLKSEFRTLPKKKIYNNSKYWHQKGTLNMGEMLYGTAIDSYIPKQLPKWSLTQISEYGVTKFFTKYSKELKLKEAEVQKPLVENEI